MTLPDDVYYNAKQNLAFLQGSIAAYGDIDSKWRVFEILNNAIDGNFNVTEYELYKRVEELENINKEQVCAISDLRNKICRLECNQDMEPPKKKGWLRR